MVCDLGVHQIVHQKEGAELSVLEGVPGRGLASALPAFFCIFFQFEQAAMGCP